MTTTETGLLADAIDALTIACGTAPGVSTHWGVACHCHGTHVEEYDDEEDAREHVPLYEGGSVVKRTVIALAWEAVPAVVTTTGQAEGSTWPADGAAGICPDCGGPVWYAGEPGSHGAWIHDSGSENCDD